MFAAGTSIAPPPRNCVGVMGLPAARGPEDARDRVDDDEAPPLSPTRAAQLARQDRGSPKEKSHEAAAESSGSSSSDDDASEDDSDKDDSDTSHGDASVENNDEHASDEDEGNDEDDSHKDNDDGDKAHSAGSGDSANRQMGIAANSALPSVPSSLLSSEPVKTNTSASVIVSAETSVTITAPAAAVAAPSLAVAAVSAAVAAPAETPVARTPLAQTTFAAMATGSEELLALAPGTIFQPRSASLPCSISPPRSTSPLAATADPSALSTHNANAVGGLSREGIFDEGNSWHIHVFFLSLKIFSFFLFNYNVDVTMISPGNSPLHLCGASRTMGGFMRCKAQGHAPNIGDFGETRTYSDGSGADDYGEVLLYVSEENPASLSPETMATTASFQHEPESAAASVLEAASGRYLPLSKHNQRVYFRGRRGRWDLKGRYSFALERNESVYWRSENGQKVTHLLVVCYTFYLHFSINLFGYLEHI